jgi:hypothetical protein
VTVVAIPSGGEAAGVVFPAKRLISFLRAHLFKLRSGKAGGVTGARRASRRIFAAQYLMGLGSEHGAAEGVAMRAGTGAHGAPNKKFNRS